MTRAPARTLLLLLCALILAACLAAPASASLNVGSAVPAPYLMISAGERHDADLLLLTALALYLGADVNVVIPLYPHWGFDDIATILVISKHCHRPPAYVIGVRRKHPGWGWGQVAHALGVHPGAFNQKRVWDKKQDREVGGLIVLNCVSGYWGIPSADVRRLRGRSYPWHEIVLAANVATWSGKPLHNVLTRRSQKHSWNAVAAHFGVAQKGTKVAKGRLGPAPGKPKVAPAAPGKAPGGPKAPPGKGGAKPQKGPKGGAKPSRGHGGGHG